MTDPVSHRADLFSEVGPGLAESMEPERFPDAEDRLSHGPDDLGPVAREALRGVRARPLPEQSVVDPGQVGPAPANDPGARPTTVGSPADRTVPPLGGDTGWLGGVVLALIVGAGALALMWATTDPKAEDTAPVVETFREPAGGLHDLPRLSRGTSAAAPDTGNVTPATPSQPDWGLGLDASARPDPRAGNQAPARVAPPRRTTADGASRRAAVLARRRASTLVFDQRSEGSLMQSPDPSPTGARTEQTGVAAYRGEGGLDASAVGSGSRFAGTGLVAADTAQPSDANVSGGAESLAARPREARLLRTSVGGVPLVDAQMLPDGDYLLTQGTTIPGVLEIAIQSDLPGMLRAVVSSDVYSRTGARRLVPRGSTLIGRYASGIQTGERRVFVVWTRVERPDGVVVELQGPGTDPLGRAGLGGEVERHLLERFGASFLFSVIGAGVAILDNGDGGDGRAERELYRDSADSLNRTAAIALEGSLDIPPTIHVDQGTRITIFVGRDLDFASALRAR